MRKNKFFQAALLMIGRSQLLDNTIKLPDKKEWPLKHFSTLKHVAKVCIISVPSKGDKLETAPQQQAWENLQWRAWKTWSQVNQASFFPGTMKNALAQQTDAEEPTQKIFFSHLIQRLSEVLLRWAACLCVVCYPDWKGRIIWLAFWTSDFFWSSVFC